MTHHAKGTFVVKMGPSEASATGKEAGLGQMTIDKTFSGELEATSQGEMLTGGTEDTGAMAYVAIERVTGKLAGRNGSFLLMHRGTMMKTDPQSGELRIEVVPHSGTGELTDLQGTMSITIDQGNHAYEFNYQLP